MIRPFVDAMSVSPEGGRALFDSSANSASAPQPTETLSSAQSTSEPPITVPPLVTYSDVKVKANAYNAYIVPQAAYRCCSGTFCVTDGTGTAYGHSPSPRPQTFIYNQTAIQLVWSVARRSAPPVIHVITWIINLQHPEGWKAELAWLADP